jgi:hypothetical protein
MTLKSLIASGTAAAVLAVPAFAVADKPADKPAKPTKPAVTQDAPSKSKGNAYGKLCKGQSKKHVKGQKGTPFSQCVKAMKKLDEGTAKSAKEACKSLSKKHVKGQKGTPYSRCIVAAAQLNKGDDDSSTTTPPNTSTTTPTPTTTDTPASTSTPASTVVS